MENADANSQNTSFQQINSPKLQTSSIFSNSRLTTAAVFAFLPFSGAIGVHNFILKQYKKGLIHILIVISSYAPYIFLPLFCNYSNNNCNNLIFLVGYVQYLAIASYVWAIVEGVNILESRKKETTPQPGYEHSTNDSPSVEVPSVKQNKDRKTWSILSIIATIIPILFWIYCLIVSGGSTIENGPGGVWWLMIMYYWSLGVPLSVASIAFGIVGLKTSLRWLSIVSLALKATTIIAIILFFAIR